MTPDREVPAPTPTTRREQLERELTERASARRTPVSMPRSASDTLGLSRAERRIAERRTVARLARAHRDEYLGLLAEELATVAGSSR